MAKRFSFDGLETRAGIVKVYDGDTITAEFPLPHDQFKLVSPRYRWSCRIVGIDTPELRSKNRHVQEHAYKARDRVRELILGQECKLDLCDFDKYGRVLCSVTTPDGRDLANILIDEGLALSYSGGKKADWSERVDKDEN